MSDSLYFLQSNVIVISPPILRVQNISICIADLQARFDCRQNDVMAQLELGAERRSRVCYSFLLTDVFVGNVGYSCYRVFVYDDTVPIRQRPLFRTSITHTS